MDFSGVKTRLGLIFEAKQYFLPGHRINGITIIDKIGEGGMGLIYRGTDQRGNLVALKVIAGADEEGSSELRDRYRREVHTMKIVQGKHPTFPDIKEHGEHAFKEENQEITFPTITMPLYHGRNLTQTKVDHPFCYVEAICRVLEGLDVLHRNKIIHRDIKPDNIFLTWDDEIKLLDYGIAKGDFLKNLTRVHDGGIIGSLNYMAPEQFSEKPIIDQRTDLYGAGMCMYTLITQNHNPILGSNPSSFLKNMLERELPKVSDSLPIEWKKFSDEVCDLDHIISKMMAIEMPRRFSCAQETLDALKPYRSGHINSYVEPLDLRALISQAINNNISDDVFSQIVKKRFGDILWLPPDLTDKLAADPDLPVFLPDKVKPSALKKDSWIMGRGKNQSDIVLIENDGGISRAHALTKKSKSGYKIWDLTSSNGTYLGGSNYQNLKFDKCLVSRPYDLKPLEWVRFGAVIRRFVPADRLRMLILGSLPSDDDIDPGKTNVITFE